MPKTTRKQRTKLKASGRKPAPDQTTSDPMDLLRDEKIAKSRRLKLAVNMLAQSDGRALPFVQEMANAGMGKTRIKAASALVRYGKRAAARRDTTKPKKERNPMNQWFDAVEALSETERRNYPVDHLKQWLKDLDEQGVKRRDLARMWSKLDAHTPQILIDYLASMETRDAVLRLTPEEPSND